MKSKTHCVAIRAALLLCLTTLLASCANRQIQYATVKTPYLPIPASLLSECLVPDIPRAMTYGDSVLLNFRLLDSLDECNGKLRAISKIDENRA
ncbi:Rz-like spanin [Erwinia phage Midgardsormr38]|uniref:Rz1 lytic protein n=1 Tax=Erwinia phage Midgardsormr38 TaxID=2663326 RepID=A0A5Q2F809_9CAUD|nr:Rz-like spanin [Erwinia phage Midgardsormr38]QGF22047.1 Rz1 lytic protein [Erwinia phage Midgardsormr38]